MRMIIKSTTLKNVATLILAWIGWILFVSPLFDRSVFLPGDNRPFMLPTFSYIVSFTDSLFSLPNWIYHPSGGVWSGVTANSLLILAPHRLLGYLLTWTFSLEPNFAYKLAFLIFGMGFFLTSCFLLALSVTRSLLWSAFFVTSLALAGNGTFFHQEMVLGTIILIPTLLYLGNRSLSDIQFLPIFSFFLGASLNYHYPQKQFIYWTALLLSFSLFSATFRQKVVQLLKTKKLSYFLLASVVSLLLGAGPLLVSYASHINDLRSRYRGAGKLIVPDSYDTYLKFNQEQLSSVTPDAFARYLGYEWPEQKLEPPDGNLLSIGWLMAFAPLLVFSMRSGAGPHILLTLFLAWAAMGIYGGAPRLLWNVMPGGKLFRQWYHLLPMVNLHFTIAILLAFQYWIDRFFIKGRSFVVLTVMMAVLALNLPSALSRRDDNINRGLYYWPPMTFVLNPELIFQKFYYERYTPLDMAFVKTVDSAAAESAYNLSGLFRLNGDSFVPDAIKMNSAKLIFEFLPETYRRPANPPCKLTVNQAFVPGWEIKIDGVTTNSMTRTGDGLIEIPLPTCKISSVEMSFTDRIWSTAVLIYLFGFLGFGAAAIGLVLRRRPRN